MLYTCADCNKTFACQSRLCDHVKTRCPLRYELQYNCSKCSRIFNTQSALRMHITYDHTPHRFSCRVCGKKYPTRFTLCTHICIHTACRPYSCTVCDRDYTTLTRLKTHVRRSHKSELESVCIRVCETKEIYMSDFIASNMCIEQHKCTEQ